MANAGEGEAVRRAAAALLPRALVQWPRAFGRGTAIAEALFEDSWDGVALLDLDGRIVRANPTFAALTGVGTGALIWDRLPKAAAPLRTALRQSDVARLTITLPGSARRTLDLRLLPVGRRGAILRVCDQTRVQELEHALGQSQRLQAVGELAGGIAHDFNNLLTAILGATDDLRARAAGRPDGGGEWDQADLELVHQSAERGAALVRQLLAFSRQQTLQPSVLALNEAVRSTSGLLRRLLGAQVVLDVMLEEPGREICIDPTQLDQVLINLAVNASHAMKQGGTLTIATGHALRLRPEKAGGELVPPGRYASLTVTDTGEGISPEILPRIFEPFFTTRRRSGGTGLGLSTVHGIVRQSGGYMDVRSVVGQGTVFEILLPRHEASPWSAPSSASAAAAASAMARPVPAAAIQSRTLLLVDDEGPVRTLADRVLTRAGWQVISAASGEDALELVDAGELGPALACVISDVLMPGIDGPALVRALRRARPDLPAILMSGYADVSLRHALQSADIRFLAKPFAMKDLTTAIEAVVGLPKAA